MSKNAEMAALGRRAKAAARRLVRATTEEKNAALVAMATALEASVETIIEANAMDLAHADQRGITDAMRDRLMLDAGRVTNMAQGLREVEALADPVGLVVDSWDRPNGLQISQVRIPLGVIGIIYEARPNVTADAAGLCLKSSNVVFLRGGSEAEHSNDAILRILRKALESSGLPADVVMSLPSSDRAWITEMMHAEDYLDVIIPRGGEGLIRFVTENSRVPVIKHYKGVCHVYVDAQADLPIAADICFNAKVHRPGVCNAMETMLVHRDVAQVFLPMMATRYEAAGVELRGCLETRQYIQNVLPATSEDYHAEFLDLILAVKVVSGVEDAIEHIEEYGSNHTESIVSENSETVQYFLNSIQSSVVMANASTRFSDGGQMGLGAEIGISTSKLHAYGPMGVTDLTTRKYVIRGAGQVRS